LADNNTTLNTPYISIVIPLLNEEESLRELFEQTKEVMSKADYSFEMIFVDDGSTDTSWEVIKKLASEYPAVARGIKQFRNYGKSAALQNGFEVARGQVIITMDADLQDDPNELPEMIQRIKDGAHLVSGWKKKRHDPISKTIPSRFFNGVTSAVSGIKLHDFNCGLKAYDRRVIERVHIYGEMHRYIPLLAKNEGFTKIEEQVVQHHARKYGVSKFGLSRFINGFLDLMTLVFMSKYKHRPMHFFGSLGTLFLAGGFAINVYLTIVKLLFNDSIGSRPLLFLGILLMVLGAQFFCTGFLGELLNKGAEKSTSADRKQVAEQV
jgi:glycosyltransferase involved in cell wall biosynthesis